MNMYLAAAIPPWLETLLSAVINSIAPILVVVATAGILYAIVVCFRFVKADNKEERTEAKSKLITVIVGIVVTVVLIALFFWLSYAFRNGIIPLDSIR